MFKAERHLCEADVEVDVVEWWAHRKEKFAILSLLAPLYLIPSASTAAVEKLFSIAGRVCRPYRAQLTPNALSLLVTLKHQRVALKRLQSAKQERRTACAKQLIV